MASSAARIILGIVFVAAGALAFFGPGPPGIPGLGGEFFDAYHKSHWDLFVAAAQIITGVLLLVNRYVTVALIILAAFIYNSFAFHLMMFPSTVIAPIVALILWLLVALRYRESFAQLFTARPRR